MSPLKVYGWSGFAAGVGGGQQRIIVAARSFAEVRRLCDASSAIGWPGRDWMDETGNENDIAVAIAQPGIFFAQPLNPIDGRDWVAIGQPKGAI